MRNTGRDGKRDGFKGTEVWVYDSETVLGAYPVFHRVSRKTTMLWQALCASIIAGSILPGMAADGDAAAGADAAAKSAEADAPSDAAPARLFTSLSDWRQRLSARGFDFSVEYLSEVIGNVSGGVKRGGVYEGLVKVGLDFDGEKLLGWKGGSLHVSSLYAMAKAQARSSRVIR